MARGERGYNLIELLMAMALSTIIFMSITALYTYQADGITAQNHVLTSTRDARFAFEHLRRDLLSLGSNSTPNSDIDDWVCPKPPVSLRALSIGFAGGHVVRPDLNPYVSTTSLTLFGALDVKTTYETESITGKSVKLLDDGGLPANEALWNDAFNVDRYLRIATPDGKSMIIAITATSFNDKTVTLLSEPPQLVGAQRCGYQGAGAGLQVNVLGFARYRVIADTRPTAPVDAKGAATRTLLVRERLAVDGVTLVGSLPLAENVVEVGVYDVGMDTDASAEVVAMQSFPFVEDVAKPDGSGLLGTSLAARPEALRFLTAKISVRADNHRRGLAHLPRAAIHLPMLTYKLDENADGAAPVTTIGGRVTMPTLVSKNL
jgi:prepilin-type N-terminal cleavage/methylation domain-containing protein